MKTQIDKLAGAPPVGEELSRTERRRRAREAQRHAAARGRRRARLLRWGLIAAVGVALIAGTYWYWTAAPATAGRPGDPRITLGAGTTAPDFALPSTDGRQVSLSDYRATKNVLLFFQEGVMCPPCWQQMRDLQADSARLDALNVALVTIAVDPLPMLAENASRERVGGMTLLEDEGARVSRAYQAVYVSMHPGERPGHTFVLVDTEGTIRWRQDFVEMYVPDQRVLGPVAQALESGR